MPTYEYRCLKCEHKFEIFQSISAEPLSACPLCGQRVERLIGGGMGIIFKGSGFYCTDSKKSSSAAAPAKNSEPSKPESSSSSLKKETEKAAS